MLEQDKDFTFDKLTFFFYLNFDVLLIMSLNSHTLKRPANSNILKTANKDSKLPKIPMSKPGSCISATTKGSTTPSQSRHSLIPRPSKCKCILEHISTSGLIFVYFLHEFFFSFFFFFLQPQIFRRMLG